MGLYLCVFKNDEEVGGVEVGFYEDFGFFRDIVLKTVEKEQLGSVCPTLMRHSDCDRSWTSEEATKLKSELTKIKERFVDKPPIETQSEWQQEVRKALGLKPANLYECFIDIDGELLIERLIHICDVSIRESEPILFQ